MPGTHLGIGQLPVLEGGHVAPEAELFTVEPFQVLFPLGDLGLNLVFAAGIRDDGQLQLGHVLQLLVLEEREKEGNG